jgi:2,3-bisphosphoglycerate-independent phosphoglycerate mutase
MIISRHGRYRFQTGMITATLLSRGLEMENAFSISNLLRDHLANRGELTSDELELELQRMVFSRTGHKLPEQGTTFDGASTPIPMLKNAHGVLPFSRGILMRFLITAGLGIEPAMSLANEVQGWLKARGGVAVDEEEVEGEVARLMLEQHGEAHARRYNLTGWIRRADKPVVILIGGATGTGKSTMAMELAFRLGIRLVNGTDMIRATMRTVLSSEVVPGLHDHSFRGMVQGGQVLSDPRERVLAGFRQQSAQVAVGIRAVIKRAIRENSHIIIEGTHLLPPFSQYLPRGADVYCAGLVLAVPEESRHKDRFPERAKKSPDRTPDTYLDAFQSVRWIHDDLLSSAEEEGAVVVANERLGQTVLGVVEYLSHVLPMTTDTSGDKARKLRTLMLVIDGMSDEPNPALNGQTPLQAAHTPWLNTLAGSGGLGRIMTSRSANGPAASTDEGMLALLARGDVPSMGRGIVEAMGQGLPIPPGCVMFRGNMATRKSDGAIVDRRAGRIRAGVADLLTGMRNVPLPDGVTGSLFPGHEHRVVVMLQGEGLSPDVSNTDPGSYAPIQRILDAKPLNGSIEANRTANALSALLDIAHEHLAKHPHNAERVGNGKHSANCIITRGAASTSQVPSKTIDPDRAALVASCGTALGVAQVVGMVTGSTGAMTGNLDTDLGAKFNLASELLQDREMVTIHIKGTDIAAHDQKPLEKRDFISKVDMALGQFLNSDPALLGNLRVVVTADHGTSSITGDHIPVPVPLLLSMWQGRGEKGDFSEDAAAQGALGQLQPGELAELLWG